MREQVEPTGKWRKLGDECGKLNPTKAKLKLTKRSFCCCLSKQVDPERKPKPNGASADLNPAK